MPRYAQSWYRGPWNWLSGPGYYYGFGPGWGGYGWGGYGSGFGLGNYGYGLNPWYLNSLGYRWGYYGNWFNPYYVSDYYYPYNYRQPVYITTYVRDEVPATVASDVEAARDAFLREDYERALSHLDRAVKNNPSDNTAHEMRALALFALGRYDESAATLNSLLAVAPGWNWETMRSFYRDAGVYTDQLRELELYVRDEPDHSAARFVLAYHYLTAGHQDSAQRQLEEVVALEPKDRVARQLLAGLKGEERSAPAPTGERIEDIDTRMLTGSWTAERDGGAAFELQLDRSGQFEWIAGEGRDGANVAGDFEVNGQTLVLNGEKGETLMGHVTSVSDNSFKFKLLGSPPTDPGLEFVRR